MNRTSARQIVNEERLSAAEEEFSELITGMRPESLFVNMAPEEFNEAVERYKARYGILSHEQHRQYVITLQRLQKLDDEDYRDQLELAEEEMAAVIRKDKAHIRGYIVRGIDPDTGKYFESLEAFESAVRLIGELAPHERDIYASSHVLLDVKLQERAGKR